MISLSEARRIALGALGFDRSRPRKVDGRQISRAIRDLGLVQIDFVNVLVPAHYLVLFSRLGPYDRSRFDEIVYRGGEFTEQWAHEACILPMETWPLLRHRMATFRVRPYGFETFLRENVQYVEWVHAQVRERGRLTAAELTPPDGIARRVRPEAWLGTNDPFVTAGVAVPRVVLEALFARGRLAIAERRPNFARAYDLAERLIPAEHHGRVLRSEDANRELVQLAAHAYGIGTADDLADYYRMSLREARPRIAELVEAKVLEEVQVEGWRGTAYLDRAARVPRRIDAASLLSPFDPVLWYRPRATRLFGFDYRIEIYTPPAQRKYGYYVLPFLMGDRLVARVDLKADRKEQRVLVLSAHLEPDTDASTVAESLGAELRTVGRWLNLDSVCVARKSAFERSLAAAL